MLCVISMIVSLQKNFAVSVRVPDFMAKKRSRGQPNQGPLDLQSNALPLSYIPVGHLTRKTEYKSFRFKKKLHASIQSLHLCFCNVIYFLMCQIVKSLHDNNSVTWDGIWYFSFCNFMESLWACFTVMFPVWELFVSKVHHSFFLFASDGQQRFKVSLWWRGTLFVSDCCPSNWWDI